MRWHGEDRAWPDGIHTTEWFVDISFQDAASWDEFQQRWFDRLTAQSTATSPISAPANCGTVQHWNVMDGFAVGDQLFAGPMNAVSSTSPIGCQTRPSNCTSRSCLTGREFV